jgi:hypothetical protein
MTVTEIAEVLMTGGRSTHTRGFAALAMLLTMMMPSGVGAQTFFDATVPADAAAPDFITIATFSTPSGIGTARKTMLRILLTVPVLTDCTAAPNDCVVFQLTPSAGFQVLPVANQDILVDGGALAVERVSDNAGVVDTLRAEIISDPPDSVAVAGTHAMLRVTIQYTDGFDFGGAALSWTLRAKERAIARRYTGFVHTGTDDPATGPNEVEVLATRAKAAPIETLNFGDVQTNLPDALVPVREYQLQNVGTDTLTIVGSINPPASAFSVFGGFGISPVLPMGTLSVPMRFRPLVQGSGASNTTTVSIDSNDPDAPATVTLSGRGISIEGVLLVDLSGSMGYTLNGNNTAPELESRLWQAKQGGLQLYNAYRELTGGQARFGIFGFPDPDGASVSSLESVPLNTADLVLGPVSTKLGTIGAGGLRANGGTPMSSGLQLARDRLPNASDTLRPVILLLSDGAHNEPPPPTPPTPDDLIGSLSGKGIRVYPIAYGAPEISTVDHAQLQRLADGTNGVSLPANPTDFIQLKKAFYTGLREWLGLHDVIDPKSTISASQSKSHDVCIDDQARAIVFTVNWAPNQTNAVQFDLETPTGATVTAGPNASVFRQETGTMWIVKGALVRQGAGAGLWRLNLRGAQNLQGALEYGYTAQVQSYVATPSTFNLATTFGNWQATVNLASMLPQLRDKAKVTLRYDRPEESYGTYLATEEIDASLLVARADPAGRPGGPRDIALASLQQTTGRTRVPETIMDERASFAQRKAWALANIEKRPFGNKRSTGTLELFDNGTNGDAKAGDGIYTANGFSASVDGIYEMVLEIAAQAAPRQCVQRMSPFSKYVAVGLTPARLAESMTWMEVDTSPFFDDEVMKVLQQEPERGVVRRMVVVTPRDQGGNYYGPGHANDVRFTLTDARPIGATQDRLDGSYVQVVEYASSATPIATVAAAGVTSNAVQLQRAGLPRWLWILLIVLVLLAIVFVVLKRRRPATP